MLKKQPIYQILSLFMIILLVFGSIFLRIHIWQDAGGFYTDEGSLILNIQERGYLQLFLPLDYAQCCPALFLVLAKIIYSVNGVINEANLRCIPLMFSIFSCLLFAIISFRVCNNLFSRIFAIVFLGLNRSLLQYSQEFKQYSSDVFFCLLVILIAIYLKDKSLDKKKLFILGLLASALVWASYTSIFAVCAGGLAYILIKDQKNLKTKLKNGLYFALPYFLNFVVMLKINGIGTLTNKTIQFFWSNYECFFPTSPMHLFAFLKFIIWDSDKITIVCSILALFGIFYLVKYQKYLSILLLGILGFAILSGLLKLYPLAPNRVSLFLIPVFILIIAKAFDFISFKTINKSLISVPIIVSWLWIFYSMDIFNQIKYYYSTKMIFKQTTAKEYVDILSKVKVNPDDIVYVDMGSQNVFELYLKEKNMKLNNYFFETRWDDINITFNHLPLNKCIHIYHSPYNPNPFAYEAIQKQINANCKIIEEQKTDSGTYIKCLKISKHNVK